jgi:hypothetical protein
MGSIFKWIKECFNYYIFQDIGQELINQINQSDSQVSSSVKQDLIASIMMNKPEDFQEHIKNTPSELQDNLMNRLMRASQMYSSPIEKYNDSTDYKFKFDRVIEQLKLDQNERSMKQEHRRFMDAMKKPSNRVIHTGQIIPSDQFLPVHVKPIHLHDPVVEFPHKDWHRSFNRVLKQLKFKQFIKVCRYNKMEHHRCLEAQKHPEDNMIHTGQIIPSGQFNPPMSTIYWYDLEVKPTPRNWRKVFNRVLEQFKLKHFIKVCRYQKKEHHRCLETQKHLDKQVIHTGKIIPSGQFKPISTPISCKPLPVPTPHQLDLDRLYNRCIESLKLKNHIRRCRKELNLQ